MSERLNTRNKCKLGLHIIVQVLDFLGEIDFIEKTLLKPFGEAGLQRKRFKIFRISTQLNILQRKNSRCWIKEVVLIVMVRRI